MTRVFRLDPIGVVDVTGTDRDAIVHNLTTNEIKALSPDAGCETFVTDVRGKILAHVSLFRLDDRIRMIGPSVCSERIVEHVDRYTIREDAVAEIRNDGFVGFLLDHELSSELHRTMPPSDQPARQEITLADLSVDGYSVSWLGGVSMLLLVEKGHSDEVQSHLVARGITLAGEKDFHARRTLAGFPWYGVDLDESNLPQEADRDEAAISFTKGCYLGQETVARLDALGQVQKKLITWQIKGAASESVRVGTKLEADGKIVGRLTSVATRNDGTITAIGFARRSHFDAGSEAKGTDEVNGGVYTAVVSDGG